MLLMAVLEKLWLDTNVTFYVNFTLSGLDFEFGGHIECKLRDV